MIYTCKHKPVHVHNNEYEKVLHEIITLKAHLHHKVTTENEQKENK